MRRIAQVLRAGTMSLYWHVASKEHLIDLMLEELVGEIDVPDPSGDWQADLRAYALSHRASLLRHQWVIDYIGGRPALGPNTLRATERTLALLADLDLDAATELTIVQAVNTYVLGAVLREFQELRVQRDQERLLAELSSAGARVGADFAAWRARLESTGEFPRFLRIFTENIDPDAEETRDQRFEFGLDCLLRGIAVTADGAPPPEPATPPGT
jgi:AcrR family transcriptional regulator